MLILDEIDTMPIVEVKRDFCILMNEILMMYGDSQEETGERCEQTDSLCPTGTY